MSLELVSDQPVQFIIVYEHGTMVQVSTTCPLIDHFLRRVKVSQSEHTWVNYAHDLKVFFTVVCQPLEQIDRQSCIAFEAVTIRFEDIECSHRSIRIAI